MDHKMSALSCSLANELRLKGEHFDVIIEVNGTEFNAHKIVLCECSPYFRALLRSMYNPFEKKYRIPDITADIMDQILQYAYTGSVPITTGNVQSLFIAADQFNILGIIGLCSEFLIDHLSVENCIGLHKFLGYFFYPDLQHKVFMFILQNFNSIASHSAEFLELSVLELQKIIANDHLNVKQEEAVFEAIVKWIDVNPAMRKEFMSILLPKNVLLVYTSGAALAPKETSDFLLSMKVEVFFKEFCPTSTFTLLLFELTGLQEKNSYYLGCIIVTHTPLTRLSSMGCRGFFEILRELCEVAATGSIIHLLYQLFICDVKLFRVRLSLLNSVYFWNFLTTHRYVKNNGCGSVIFDAVKDLNLHPSDCYFVNPLARPRLPYFMLFSIGGWSRGGPTNAIETYNCRADLWLNVTFSEESPRAYHGAAYLNGFIYLIGGFNGLDYFNSVRKFDPVTKRWNEAGPMHCKRCYVSVTVLGNCIYAMGGFDGHIRLNTVERYEPETNQWTLIAPMHEERSDANATTHKDKIYICGGFNGNECLATAEVYSLKTMQWSLISSMTCARSGVGVIAYGNHVYAIGGFDGITRLRTVEYYNPGTNTWQHTTPMNNRRSNFAVEEIEDMIFVVGGYNGHKTTSYVERYDEKTNKWYEAQEMHVDRSALSCCVVPGLANIREYSAKLETPNREEPRTSVSTSALPV
ncbi:kelch-like protein 10 [Gastrophryne carolinensis]